MIICLQFNFPRGREGKIEMEIFRKRESVCVKKRETERRQREIQTKDRETERKIERGKRTDYTSSLCHKQISLQYLNVLMSACLIFLVSVFSKKRSLYTTKLLEKVFFPSIYRTRKKE